MIAFKGRANIKQHMPKKPVKHGIKVWMHSDSGNGYICQFDIYTGKSRNNTEGGLGENVVKRLTWAITGKHHCVYMDNFLPWRHFFSSYFRRTYMYMHVVHCAQTENTYLMT